MEITYDREYFADLIKENLSPKSLKAKTSLVRNRANKIIKVCAPKLNESSSVANCKCLQENL